MMDSFSIFIRSMNIARGGVKALVAKQNLNGGRIGPGFSQIRGKAVTEGMRRNWQIDFQFLPIEFNPLLQIKGNDATCSVKLIN